MFILLCAVCLWQIEPDAAPAPPVSPEAARVNGHSIRVHDVQRELVGSTRGREVAAETRQALEAAALSKLIDRELVMEHLRSTQMLATDAEIQQQWERLKKRLETRQIPPEKHLQEKGFRDLDHWRHEARWELSWNAFLTRYVNDDNLEKFFLKHRRHYDGSTVRLAHILLKAKNAESFAKARQRGEEIRESIRAKKMTFEAAAKEFSQSPTAAAGGEIGFIDRHQTMPESFSAAAFNLEVGEISEPVVSRYGVHLIRCLEIKPGQADWKSAREQLLVDVKRWLFRWAADKQRAQAKIHLTGATAHWKTDGGRRVLVPAK